MSGKVTGTIFDIRRYSIHDGPGIRTAIFFKGCPLNCRWCHNPEGMSFEPELIFRSSRCILCDDCLGTCPNDAISRLEDSIQIDRSLCKVSGLCALSCPAEALEVVGKTMTAEQVMAEIERDRTFYDQTGGGVTFTGGEPLAQPQFLKSLLVACRTGGIHTAVDTSGHAPWEFFKEILPQVNLFLYDLKLVDEAHHLEWTGVSNADILSNLQELSQENQAIIVRIPVIPGINDDQGSIRLTGEFLSSLAHIPKVELLSYHNIAEAKYAGLGKQYDLKNIHPPAVEQMHTAARMLEMYGLVVSV